MEHPLIGTWKPSPGESHFDVHHRPSAVTLAFDLTSGGEYGMTAHGSTADGQEWREKPARFAPDGVERPVLDFPGLTNVALRPDPNTLTAEVKRADGSIAGTGSYVVSPDRQTLTATTFGFDSELRQFNQQTVWNRH